MYRRTKTHHGDTKAQRKALRENCQNIYGEKVHFMINLPQQPDKLHSGRSVLIRKFFTKTLPWGGSVSPFIRASTGCLLFVVTLIFSVSPCLSGGFSQVQAAEIRTLTLDQALAIAAEKNRDIAAAQEYARYLQGKYVEERSAALPQIGLNGAAQLGRDSSQRALGADFRQYSRTLDLTLSQPLYTWGKLSAAIRAAEVGLKTADEELRRAQQGARRDVATAFYDLLLAKELRTLALQNREQKKKHADEAHRRFSAGVATDYDVLAADVSLANTEPGVIRSENRIRLARERLRILLMLPDEIDVTGTLEALPTPPPPLETARAAAREKRPEIRDLKLKTGIYQELVTIANAENKPRLDLKGGAGWHHLDAAGTQEDGAAWNIGVYLSFPFFDGFKTDGKTEQAKSDLASQRIKEGKVLDSIDLDVQEALHSLQESASVVAALAETVTQAKKLLAMAEKGYEYGVKTRIDVDDAQLNLLQAATSRAEAQRSYLAARVSLDWSMGVLGE